MPAHRRNLTGQRFGRLVAVAPVRRERGTWIWAFRCDCGAEIERRGSSVTCGDVQSCGCLMREILKRQQAPTHGMSKTRLYSIWRGMKKRCYTPKAVGYDRYGGRGLGVCSEWKDSFEKFRDWSLANGYEEHLTLDRKDNDKGYSPDNCRWVTWIVQENNKRNLLDKPGAREKIERELERDA